MSIKLRDYQQTFIDDIRAAYASGHRSVMGVAPTGFGKTKCFNYIAHNASLRGNTSCVLVHRKELIRQTSQSLTDDGIPHGIIAAGYPELNFPIQVCSVQTLARRLDRYTPPDLLVIDECHHTPASTYEKVIEWAPNAVILGVTATPIRLDGRGFGKYYSEMICGDDTSTLIANGWLSKPRLFAPPIPEIDLSDVSTVAGEYNKLELGLAMDKQVITGSAVEHYKRLLPHFPPTLVFCVSVEHARHVAAEFCANGIPSAAIDGSMSDEERISLISAFANGAIRCLMTCDLVSEGFDLPAIVCVILLRPTKSLALLIQQIGRALRMFPGKIETLIIDHVKNWQLENCKIAEILDGHPDWSSYFMGRKKRSKSTKGAALTSCPKCYCVFPPTSTCPNCGHNLRVAGESNGRKIEEREGNLVEIDREKILSFRATTARGFKRKQVIEKLQRADPARADPAQCYCSAVSRPLCGYCEGGWMTEQLQEA